MIRRIFSGRQAIPPFLPLVVVFITAFVLSCKPSMAEEEEWRFVYGAKGVKVHKRIKEGSRLLEFKACGDLRGKITDYTNVLLDTDKMPDWAPLCLEAKNIEQVNESQAVIYVAYEGVWPVADRDYVARRTVISDIKKTTVRININLDEYHNVPVCNNRVHITHLQCSWVLKRIDSSSTHVELNAFVDPGGRLPAWLVNWGYRWIPYRFLKNLEGKVVERSNKSTIQFVTVSSPPH